MADKFTPITTQEEFNSRIQERINRINKKYEGYVSPEDAEAMQADLRNQIEGLQKQIDEKGSTFEELQEKKKENDELQKTIYQMKLEEEKIKALQRENLPLELLDHINGSTYEEVQRSARDLAYAYKMKKPNTLTAPLASYDSVGEYENMTAEERAKKADMMKFVQGLKF